MAVFRIEKTREYTVMSNRHLRNAGLPLKSKRLLSMMLSLPDDWNYTTRSLAKICKEGTDSIEPILKDLKQISQVYCMQPHVGQREQNRGYEARHRGSRTQVSYIQTSWINLSIHGKSRYG